MVGKALRGWLASLARVADDHEPTASMVWQAIEEHARRRDQHDAQAIPRSVSNVLFRLATCVAALVIGFHLVTTTLDWTAIGLAIATGAASTAGATYAARRWTHARPEALTFAAGAGLPALILTFALVAEWLS